MGKHWAAIAPHMPGRSVPPLYFYFFPRQFSLMYPFLSRSDAAIKNRYASTLKRKMRLNILGGLDEKAKTMPFSEACRLLAMNQACDDHHQSDSSCYSPAQPRRLTTSPNQAICNDDQSDSSSRYSGSPMQPRRQSPLSVSTASPRRHVQGGVTTLDILAHCAQQQHQQQQPQSQPQQSSPLAQHHQLCHPTANVAALTHQQCFQSQGQVAPSCIGKPLQQHSFNPQSNDQRMVLPSIEALLVTVMGPLCPSWPSTGPLGMTMTSPKAVAPAPVAATSSCSTMSLASILPSMAAPSRCVL